MGNEYHGFDYLCFTGIGYLGLLATGRLANLFLILFGKKWGYVQHGKVIIDYDFVRRLDNLELSMKELNLTVTSLRGEICSVLNRIKNVEEKAGELVHKQQDTEDCCRSLKLKVDSILKEVI